MTNKHDAETWTGEWDSARESARESPSSRDAERRFPIQDGPSIPWEAIARHERQAERNHGQTLERLAERGGLSPCEAVAILQDREWRAMDAGVAKHLLKELAEPFEITRHRLVQAQKEIDSLRWQLTNFERETAKRIERQDELMQERDKWTEDALALQTRAEQAEAALVKERADLLIAWANLQTEEKAHVALRDGLATLPRYDLRIEADQGRVFIDSWKDEDGEWIKRADVAALLTEKT